MTVLVKKVFISSKPSIVCLLCPPPCGHFSIQESAVGGLSYKGTNNRMHALRAFYCHEPFYAKINLGQDDKNFV